MEQEFVGQIHGTPPLSGCVLHGGPGGLGEVADLVAELENRSGLGLLEPYQTQCSVIGQVEELANQITAHTDQPIPVIGWSWGAWLACLLAVRQPELVSHLVLVGSAPFDKLSHATIRGKRMAALNASQRAELEEVLTRMDDPQAVRQFQELYDICDGFDPIEAPLPQVDVDMAMNAAVWGEAKQIRDTDQWPNILSRLTCPVTAVHGADDPHPTSGVFNMLRKVQPNAHLVELPKCGHKPWREKHAREAFFSQLLTIIDQSA